IVSLFVALPVAEPDTLERYKTICRQSEAAKGGHQPAGAAGLLGFGEWLPPVLHVPFAQSLFGRRLFNVTVTNVPGPPVTLHAFGCPLERAIPIVPLAAEHAVGVAMLSYGDSLTFGVNADHDSVGDIAVLATAIGAELDELGALAAGRVAELARI
ncbi:MAG: diacylglycerol O-acyltransferase / wax synthase, partial [Solirubrobacteraceae bacterium]|nr:diacylglycerol O-acyltransferase / wax synthase [Solirubrobacteraceae bacterium]